MEVSSLPGVAEEECFHTGNVFQETCIKKYYDRCLFPQDLELSQEKKLYLGKVFVNELIGLTGCQLYAQLLVTANKVV